MPCLFFLWQFFTPPKKKSNFPFIFSYGTSKMCEIFNPVLRPLSIVTYSRKVLKSESVPTTYLSGHYSCHGNNCFCGFYFLDIYSGELLNNSHLLLKSTLRDCKYWIIWFFITYKCFYYFASLGTLPNEHQSHTWGKKMCNSKVYNVGFRLLK